MSRRCFSFIVEQPYLDQPEGPVKLLHGVDNKNNSPRTPHSVVLPDLRLPRLLSRRLELDEHGETVLQEEPIRRVPAPDPLQLSNEPLPLLRPGDTRQFDRRLERHVFTHMR
jgi:hypothetical protein